MYVMKNHGFKRKYVYGGSGLFDSLARLFTSGVAKQLTSTAIDVGKEVGKKTAIDVGTRLVKKVLTPKVQVVQKGIQRGIQKAPGAVVQRGGHSVPLAPAVATKVQNILNKYVVSQALQAPVRQNINSLIDGSGNNAIAIQDLVRKLHGSGLKTI